MTLLSPEQMKWIDNSLPKDWGLDSILLMENAALAAFYRLNKKFQAGDSVLIFCGPGNNGGDGLALARLLHSCRFNVSLCLGGDKEAYIGDSLKQYQLCRKLDLPFLNPEKLPENTPWMCMIDALLGTGMNRKPEGNLLSIINYINQSDSFCLSLDIPSGVMGSTGEVPGAAVKADETLCFGRPKPGNLLYPGYKLQGNLFYSPISIPPRIVEEVKSGMSCLDHPVLPDTEMDIYKGSRGYGLVVGGSAIYRGAPVFSAAAFLRAGGGYVHLAAPKEVIETTAAAYPEFILHDTGSAKKGWNPEHLPLLATQLKQKDWLILGPGMGQSPETGELLKRLLPLVKVPLILDGDGLSLMQNQLMLLKNLRCTKILTPHPGEAARLLGCSIEAIEKNPAAKALELAAATHSLVILKQPHSILAEPDGKLSINLSGSPTLATAGSGDILSGLIPAMLGRGLHPSNACKAAMRLHGLAGEILEKKKGPDGSTASDILLSLSEALKAYKNPSRCERIQLV